MVALDRRRSRSTGDLEAGGKLSGQVDSIVVDQELPPEYWYKGGRDGDEEEDSQGRRSAAGPGTEGSSGVPDGRAEGHKGVLWRTISDQVWPFVVNFFAHTYPDASMEDAFRKEARCNRACEVINYYGLSPVLTIPLVPMAIFNWPRRHPRLWGACVALVVWFGISGYIIDIGMCRLFALGMKRLVVVVGVLGWIALVGVTVLTVHIAFIRTLINWALFQVFVLVWHYMREQSDRRTYTLRAELKIQFKAKQKAQINERKTQDAKRRFSNYIFHGKSNFEFCLLQQR
ncbi:hypothetical protein RQP46_011069 [Phenoliferia psychrophenolica]